MKKQFITSAIITFLFLSLGFALLYFELVGFGLSLFVFLPFLLGYVLGKSLIKKMSLYGLIFSVVTFFILLIAGELEGMVCILMALPLIVGAVLLGVLINYLFSKTRQYRKALMSDEKDVTIKSSIVPFCFFLLFGIIENQLIKNDKDVVEITSEILLPYSPLKVYETIKSVDTLDAEKPFLMKLDLPIPQKCVLENERLGGIRTCYFEGGQIVERITELQKGKILKMDVIDYQLPGRRWLGFKEAIYTFEELKDGSTKMTRITTYTSELYPRFYWQPLERLGIEQEHEYVFNNLEKDLNKN